jgi:hypothetical protein
MPLPSSGSISFDDLNLELGNEPGTQLDMSSSAALFSLTAPHGMDEFYGLSLIESASFISVNPSSISKPNTGLTTTVSVTSDGIFDISENIDWITISKNKGNGNDSFTITVPPQALNGVSRNGTVTVSSNDATPRTISITQSARAAYMGVSSQTPQPTGGTYTVTITAESLVEWRLTKDYASFFVSGFSTTTGQGNGTVTFTIPENVGSERGVTFTLESTNIVLPNESVTIYQQTNVVADPTFVFSDWTGGVSINGQNGNVSATNGNSDGVSITSTNPYPTVVSSTTRIVSVTITVPSGYDNVGSTVSGTNAVNQPAYVQPTFTFSDWTGGVSVSNTGNTSYTIGNASSVSVSPSSFDVVTVSTSRDVDVTITVPSGYTNSGGTVSGTKTVTQSTVPRILTATPSSTTIEGGTTSIMLDINDVYYTDTSWTLTEDFDNTISNLTFSPSSGTGDSPYTVVSFGSNTSGGTKYGRFTLSGGDSLIEITITQNVYVAPPSISITSVSPSGPYSYEGQGNIFVNISRSGGTNYSAQITPSFDDANATFPSSQPSGITWNNSTSLTITTGTSFKVDIPSRSDGTTTTYSSNVVVNASNSGGSDSDSVSLQQTGLVTWNTSPSSLSFATGGGTQNITLNSSFSWNASVSGTGFSINTTSGNSGTNTISVTATQKDLGGSGTVTFSASGQSDIVVSLSQAAAPLEILYYINGSSSGQSSDTFTDNSISYLGESTSVGVYAYRGSTSQSTSFTLTKSSGGTYFGVSTTTSGTNTSVSSNTTQSTGASAATLYINFNSNSGNTSTRSGEVQLECGGNIVTFNLTQNSDPNAGGGSGGGDRPGSEE